MIALVTSTLRPGLYSYFSEDERYLQTINTIKRLKVKGFDKIFLFDNSNSKINIDKIKKDTFQNLNIFHTPQYNFTNKGLNEALLILNNLHNLPDDKQIFKISGRYYPTEHFQRSDLQTRIGEAEILGIAYNFERKISFFSTRSYLVRNREVLEALLKLSVEEMISYSKGIHGIKSFWSCIKSINKAKLGTEYQLSLEQAFSKILKVKSNYALVEKMNIEGFIAGSGHLDLIEE